MAEDHVENTEAALKKAGRGGWRVDLKTISEIANKCIEEHKADVGKGMKFPYTEKEKDSK